VEAAVPAATGDTPATAESDRSSTSTDALRAVAPKFSPLSYQERVRVRNA
jgi:hypothetical protein